jgi:tetratricopeptide (TPR) repeat protein
LKHRILPEPFLVGRERELKELQRCLEFAAKGKGTTVFISGEAGSGKTRLINEFLKITKRREITILSGWCLSNAALPYFPFIEAFSPNMSSREDGTIVSQQLSIRSWLSEAYSTEKLEKNKITAPQVWRDQAFASVTRELLFMSSVKPLILVLEDMHWADSASLALLHYISRALVNEKILVLVTFRSEELGRDAERRPHPLVETIQLMGREGLFKEIKLVNLDQDCVRRIAESMLGGKVNRELVEKLSEESRGNPLFVVEFLRMLSERGSLLREQDQWRLSVDKLGIPSKVKEIILRRIGALRPDQRRVLDVASVIGDKFNPDLIGGVLSKDRLEILEVLNDVLKSTSMVRVEENLYRFDHAKSREVLYEEISLPLKRGYHERIAEQIENASKNAKEVSLSDLAYHYAQAGNKEKSVKYALAAGQDAVARFSNAEAIKHFKYVLESVANLEELTVERNVALEGLGDAYAANCMYAEAIKTFDQLAESETGSLRLRALRKAMDAAFIKGDKPDLLLEYAKKAEELALDDRLEMARVIKNRGRAFAWAGRGEQKLDLADYEAALQIFEEENSLADVAEALWRRGEASISARDLLEKGLGYLLRSRAIFRELGDVRKEIAVSRAIGIAFIYLGLFPEAKRELGKVLRVGEKIGVFNELARTIGILGLIDECEGKFGEALSKVLKALEYIEKTDVNYVKGFDLGALTRLYSKLGDLKRADEYFDRMKKLPPEVLSTWTVRFNFNLTKAVYFAAKGRLKEANHIFEGFVANLEGSVFVGDYIWALEKQGRIKEAKVQRYKVQKIMEEIKNWFEHANVQLSVMVPRMVQIGEVVEMRLDLVNVAKNPGTLVKVEGLIPSGCKVISLPSFCSIQNSSIKMNKKRIDPFQVETIKIKMSFEKAGVYNLDPILYYINDLGKPGTEKAKPITITVKLGPFEEKTKSVAELLRGKLEFKSEAAEKAFNFLVSAFERDYLGRRMPMEKSGWRTRMEVVRNAKVTMYSMYGRSGQGGEVTSELVDLGVVESRFFFGERGRGGRVLKMRICYEKEPVKQRVAQQGDNNRSNDKRPD